MVTDWHILAFTPYSIRPLAKPTDHLPCINQLFYYHNTFSSVLKLKDLLRKPTHPHFMRKPTTEFHSLYTEFIRIIFIKNSHILIHFLSLKSYLFVTKNCKFYTKHHTYFLHPIRSLTFIQTGFDLTRLQFCNRPMFYYLDHIFKDLSLIFTSIFL